MARPGANHETSGSRFRPGGARNPGDENWHDQKEVVLWIAGPFEADVFRYFLVRRGSTLIAKPRSAPQSPVRTAP